MANGHFGTENDYMLQMFITCSDPPTKPTRIVMGDGVYAWWQTAADRYVHFLAKHITDVLTNPDDWMKHIMVARLDQVAEITRSLAGLAKLLSGVRDSYHGAEIAHDRELREDTMLFFSRERLVGECFGWTA